MAASYSKPAFSPKTSHMKEAIQLKIAQPCHENWQAMTPVEQGRHCGSCAKNVVDFTIMSDREIIDYISLHASGDTCGRSSWRSFWRSGR